MNRRALLKLLAAAPLAAVGGKSVAGNGYVAAPNGATAWPTVHIVEAWYSFQCAPGAFAVGDKVSVRWGNDKLFSGRITSETIAGGTATVVARGDYLRISEGLCPPAPYLS